MFVKYKTALPATICTEHYAPTMHQTRPQYAPNIMHQLCTEHARNMHQTLCTNYALNTPAICTKHVLDLSIKDDQLLDARRWKRTILFIF